MGGEATAKGGAKAGGVLKSTDRFEIVIDKLKREIEMLFSQGIRKTAALPKKNTYAKEILGKFLWLLICFLDEDAEWKSEQNALA